MAAATNGRRFTRSRKTTTPDDPTEKPAYEPYPRSLRSSKAISNDILRKGNCSVVITKLQLLENSENIAKAKRQSPARKRTKEDNGDVNRVEEQSKTKVFIVVFF